MRLVVAIERAGGAAGKVLRTEVRRGGEVLARASFTALPAAVWRWQDLVRPGFRLRARREADLARLGQAMRELCLPAGAAAALAEMLDLSPADATVEVVLESHEPFLLGMPFEALCLEGGRLLAVHPRAAILRRPAELATKTAAASGLAPPLKILVAVGAPDEGKTRSSTLNLERELQQILDAVAGARRGDTNAEVRILEVGSPEQIGEALARDEYQVLHLSCHGGPGLLELEDEDGGALRVSAAQLLAPIRAKGGQLPMVFLNCCHGAARSQEAASLAEELLRAGVPAVLAMLGAVSDHYATQLPGLFYEHLATSADWRPSRALAAARRQLEAARQRALAGGSAGGEHDRPEVAVATLFVAGEESLLVDISLEPRPLAARTVYDVGGPVPQLRIDELIGRRQELRQMLRTLRQEPRRFAGVLLSGIGGVGKSALAGRAMQRLEEEGWLVAAHAGRLGLADLLALVGQAVRKSDRQDRQRLAGDLGSPEIPEPRRFELAAEVLAKERVLLVLDDFERNLTPDGGGFLDPDLRVLLADLLPRAGSSRFLLTCRYPPPGLETLLAEVPLGPLSEAQSRKLILRLEALRERPPGEVEKALQIFGGHPRMLELLDALLRGGQGRLPLVTEKLRQLLATASVPLVDAPPGLKEQIQQTLVLGGRDVLLAELLEVAKADATAPALLQLAVSNLPVSAVGLARMLQEDPLHASTTGAEVQAAAAAIARLARLSLVFCRPDGEAWVHRWTAEGLAQLSGDGSRRQWRAGRYRLWRALNDGEAMGNRIEALRNFLAGRHFEEAGPLAWECIELLRAQRQSVSLAALASEVLETLPAGEETFTSIAAEEAAAHLSLGRLDRAMDRYQSLLARYRQRAEADPECIGHQRELAFYLHRIGDVHFDQGDLAAARMDFLDSLAIDQRLAKAEPQRVDHQQALSVSYDRIGNLYRAMGKTAEAHAAFLESFAIAERLAVAHPRIPEFQQGLSMALERLGDLHAALGEPKKARKLLRKSLKILERLAAAEPRLAEYQSDLASHCNRIGDFYLAMGEERKARKLFLQSLEIVQRLAHAEPQRGDYQRELCVSYERLGDLHHARGEREEARRAFSRALETVEQLAAAEPQRAEYQRDLAIYYHRLGDFHFDLAELDDAREAFLKDLEITARLAAAEPLRGELQRDLSVSYNRIGDFYLKIGDLEKAHGAFLKDLEIAEKLAAGEPGRADCQVDVAVAMANVGSLEGEGGKTKIRRGIAVLEEMKADGRLAPADRPKLRELKKMLATPQPTSRR